MDANSYLDRRQLQMGLIRDIIRWPDDLALEDLGRMLKARTTGSKDSAENDGFFKVHDEQTQFEKPLFFGSGAHSEQATFVLVARLLECCSQLSGHQQFGGMGSGGTAEEFALEQMQVFAKCSEFLDELDIALDVTGMKDAIAKRSKKKVSNK